MATRASIEFDFKQAMSQAEKVDEIAESISVISKTKFNNTMQNISLNWEGESARKYLSKGERLQNKMNETVRELQATADDIRRIARALYKAEMASLEIASKRDY